MQLSNSRVLQYHLCRSCRNEPKKSFKKLQFVLSLVAQDFIWGGRGCKRSEITSYFAELRINYPVHINVVVFINQPLFSSKILSEKRILISCQTFHGAGGNGPLTPLSGLYKNIETRTASATVWTLGYLVHNNVLNDSGHIIPKQNITKL
jgi:hypothetical protein